MCRLKSINNNEININQLKQLDNFITKKNNILIEKINIY